MELLYIFNEYKMMQSVFDITLDLVQPMKNLNLLMKVTKDISSFQYLC